MIYLVLTVLFLHISVMRIVIRFEILFDSDERYALIPVKLFVIPIFRFKPNYNKIVDSVKGDKKEDSGEKKKKSKFTGYIIRAALALLKRIEVRYLGL